MFGVMHAIDDVPLCLGSCRPSQGEGRRRRSRTTTEQFQLRRSITHAVVNCSNNPILCHTNATITLPTSVTLDTSVNLILSDDSFDITSILGDLYICSLLDMADVTSRGSSDNTARLCLELTGERIGTQEIEDTRCMGTVYEDAAPAISLSIHMTMPLTTTQRSTAGTFLQNAVVKRSIVGLHILWKEHQFTSDIVVAVDGEEILLRVQSVLANRERGASVPSHFVILPSTRVTLTCQRNESTDTIPLTNARENFASPAVKLLVETMDCIRTFPSAPVARSFLFSGQPGSGKTFAVRIAAEMLGDACQLTALNGSEIMATGQGPDAARALENLFSKACQSCKSDASKVAFIFLDEFDALVESEYVMAMLALSLDQVANDESWRQFLVVAATNRIDSVPAHLRRPGRFDKEVVFTAPDVTDRQTMLMRMVTEFGGLNFRLKSDELVMMAEKCVGFVPADLAALVRKAVLLRHANPSAGAFALLDEALDFVGASALRDAALTAPPTTKWSDIAGDCGGAKLALQQAIEWPRTRRRAYQHLGLQTPRGCLLYGLPGVGKTQLARAAAGSSGVAFLSLSPADVYASSYVGDAEAIIRRAFATARAAAPCVLFFDEIDSIIGSEENISHGMSRGHSAEARTLSTFLNEMDGIDGSLDDGVMVLGATNRPDTIDRALMRPGRFDKVIHVPPPDFIGRRSIFKMQCREWETDEPLDYDMLADDTISGGMTGAELVGACREAAMTIFKESISGDTSCNCKGQTILLDALCRAHSNKA